MGGVQDGMKTLTPIILLGKGSVYLVQSRNRCSFWIGASLW